ncbi:T9SS type A sorting domain-containing protein [Flavivirga aquatica]|nr:T9SS type A sorting domain-containing protein [Flavivirga aquatica]
MKKITYILYILLAFNFSYGQTALVKEDIAIVGVDTDSENFTFLLRADIDAGTQIYFSDNEVNGTGTGLNNTGEGIILFTAATNYSCGTVIGYVSNSAEFSNVFGSFALNNGGDEVLAFQGLSGTNWGTFLHANVDQGIILPVGFAATDIVDGNRDNREYTGTTSSPSWDDLNSISNYHQNNNYGGRTLSTSAFSCQVLSPGDIIITGFNSDNAFIDDFSFVLLTDIVSGTEINFTDIGWLSSGSFRTGAGTGLGAEGVVVWKATSDLACGTEIIISANAAGNMVTNYSGTIGTVTETDTGFGADPNADQIIAYQGSHTSPTMLYAIEFGVSNTGWDATSTNALTSSVPDGLIDGVNAIYVGAYQSGNYDCSITSGSDLISHLVADTSYWTLQNTGNLALGGCSYTCCSSTVTWDGSAWSGTPDITTTAIINGDYDTANGGTEVSFSACSLRVNGGFTLTISNGDHVVVENDALIDGNVVLRTEGAFVQNSDTHKYLNHESGTSVVEKETAILNAWNEYTYWSSPVTGETIGGGLAESSPTRRFLFNANNYQDSTAETGNNNATLSGQDDIDDNGNDWESVTGATVMAQGVGYAATHSKALYLGVRRYNYTFEGILNNGIINVPVVRNDTETADNDWNFIGNPYPSAIDINLFFDQNRYNAVTNTAGTLEGAIYYWSHNTPTSSSSNGNEQLNFSSSDYASHNGVGGAAGGDGVIPNGFIPSGQGFFVVFSKTRPTNAGDVVFNNAMRVSGATNNSQFFKSTKKNNKSNNDANKLWLNLTSDNGVFNQTLIGYVKGATEGDDGMYYDATKNLSSGTAAALYTRILGSGKKYVIQGKEEHSLDVDEVVNLGFKTVITKPTLYKFSIAKLEGGFLKENAIYIKDNLLNTVHDLKDSDYTFVSEVGEFNDRFEIRFKKEVLSVNEFDIDTNTLKIIELENNQIQFKTLSELTIKAVNIFDLLGRQLYRFEGNKTSETYNLSNLSNTAYIARVELSNGAVITKKAIKK